MADINWGLSGMSKCATCLHRQNFLLVSTHSYFLFLLIQCLWKPQYLFLLFSCDSRIYTPGLFTQERCSSNWFPVSHLQSQGRHAHEPLGALQTWRGDARAIGQGRARKRFAEENEAGHSMNVGEEFCIQACANIICNSIDEVTLDIGGSS